MAAEPAARQLALGGERANRLGVDLQQLGELLRRQHVRLTRGNRSADDDVAAEVPLDELGHELALRHLQLERGSVELLRRRARQANEQGVSVRRYRDISMISSGAMARKAFLLGGTGQTGHALAPRLLERGWEVVVGSRGEQELPQGVRHVKVDRTDGDSLRAALADGFDVLVDFVAFEPEHADQLLSLRDLVRSTVVLSSGAVYVDTEGRGFEPPELPRLPVPVRERQPTASGAPETYATKKAEIERRLLGQSDLPATILRAGTIYGPRTVFSREWYFVKRALDKRPVVVLADRGKSRFNPVSVHTLAELIWLAAERPGRRVLNAADPDPPNVLEIARTIAVVLDYEWVEVLVEGTPGVGETPWSVPHPFVMDMTEAEFELGYRPITHYAKAVPETVAWLVDATKDRDWREVLPRSADIMKDDFDYEAEDAFLRRVGGS